MLCLGDPEFEPRFTTAAGPKLTPNPRLELFPILALTLTHSLTVSLTPTFWQGGGDGFSLIVLVH